MSRGDVNYNFGSTERHRRSHLGKKFRREISEWTIHVVHHPWSQWLCYIMSNSNAIFYCLSYSTSIKIYKGKMVMKRIKTWRFEFHLLSRNHWCDVTKMFALEKLFKQTVCSIMLVNFYVYQYVAYICNRHVAHICIQNKEIEFDNSRRLYPLNSLTYMCVMCAQYISV